MNEVDWDAYFDRVELESSTGDNRVSQKNIALRMAKFIISQSVPDNNKHKVRIIEIIERALKVK